MLIIRNLTKVYDDGTVALRDVSFEVPDGEFLIVIGLSGSGKSTLLRCINRLIDPTEGSIFWDERDITNAESAELRMIRREIGMVFQQFNLVKRSSVLTNVFTNLPSMLYIDRFVCDFSGTVNVMFVVGLRPIRVSSPWSTCCVPSNCPLQITRTAPFSPDMVPSRLPRYRRRRSAA